jgi:hypothetical protein
MVKTTNQYESGFTKIAALRSLHNALEELGLSFTQASVMAWALFFPWI